MYRLVALDLDDTLLHDDLTISPANRKAIQQAIELGCTVILATGRMYSSALVYANQLNLDVPLITYQGALVKTSKTGDVWYERILSAEIASELVAFGQENGVHTQLYRSDYVYVSEMNDTVRAYESLGGIQIQVADLEEVAKHGSVKVLFSGEPEKLDHYAIQLKSRLGSQAEVFKSKPYYLEITHPEATKGQALAHVAERLGFKREETMACGDSWNDLDMIRYAGLGVVMANAPDDIKQVADALTASHLENGVAQAIETYILQAHTAI